MKVSAFNQVNSLFRDRIYRAEHSMTDLGWHDTSIDHTQTLGALDTSFLIYYRPKAHVRAHDDSSSADPGHILAPVLHPAS